MKNIPRMISLTEFTKDGGDRVESSVLVNIEGIVSVQIQPFETGEPVIIGVTKPTTIRTITLTTGYKLYVKESLDEIRDMIAALLKD